MGEKGEGENFSFHFLLEGEGGKEKKEGEGVETATPILIFPHLEGKEERKSS